MALVMCASFCERFRLRSKAISFDLPPESKKTFFPLWSICTVITGFFLGSL